MSETAIGNLGGNISKEDADLVDSILKDINSSGQNTQQVPQQRPQMQQGGQPQMQPQMQQGGQPSPEQIKMMQQQQQQQMAMRQQQMAQQQAMAQQAMAQKQNIINNNSDNLLDNIKLEAKNILTVVFLCIILNVEQVDNIFKSQSLFLNESGGLNLQAVFVKALLIVLAYYGIKSYLL